MIRLDWVLTGLVVLATFAVIFLVGTVAATSGLVPWLNNVPGLSPQASDTRQTLPSSDAPGRDMPGIERYPDSVRVKYESYDLGEAEVIEAEYLTEDSMEEASTFYSELIQNQGWRTAGSDVSLGEELGLLVTNDDSEEERRIFIEMEPRGDLVSIELEETSPTSS